MAVAFCSGGCPPGASWNSSIRARSLPDSKARDLTWALAFLVVGGVLIAWTAGRLVRRRPVIRAGDEGMFLALRGPFARPAQIPWDHVGEISAGTASDDYGTFPTLVISVDNPGPLDFLPWGARWLDGGVFSISAGEWDSDAGEVADRLAEVKAAQFQSASEDPQTQEISVETDAPPVPTGEAELETNDAPPSGNAEDGSE